VIRFSDQLTEGIRERPKIVVTNDMILDAAKKVVAASPKRRFSAMEIEQLFRDDAGLSKRIVDFVDRSGKQIWIGQKVESMPDFVKDRAYGYYKLLKVKPKKKGLTFQRVDRDETEVLYNGEYIGEINRTFGLIPDSSTRQSEWTYGVSLDIEELKKLGIDPGRVVPSEGNLRGINDAKRWVRSYLKKHLPR
jgi:hypothetical protein